MTPIQIALSIFVIVSLAWLAARCGAKPRDEDMAAAAPVLQKGFLLDAAPSDDGMPVERCVTRFFIRPGERRRYCAQDGDKAVHCHTQPTAAIVDANEDADAARCSQIFWGFGCDPDLLCRLQQSGSNLVSDATAELVRKEGCGLPARLSC